MRSLALTSLLLASATALAAEKPALDARAIATAESLRASSDTGTDAYALLESLTTEIGPRMAGSPAFDRAIDWAQAKFKALGYDKVYLEPVTFPVWERRHE